MDARQASDMHATGDPAAIGKYRVKSCANSEYGEQKADFVQNLETSGRQTGILGPIWCSKFMQ